MMNEKTIAAAREALEQAKGFIESETGERGDILALYKLKNFIDLAEKHLMPATRYAIAYNDLGDTVYWVTRAGDTDNYSLDKAEATTFADRSAAAALMRVLKLDEDSSIVEV